MVNQVEFWQQRWVNNQTGFHEGNVNIYLEKYYSYLSIPDKGTVFVPLCGKSHDLIWLSKLGFNIIGVECSELAVKAFFVENNLEATISNKESFNIWTADNITIYCGDFYELKPIWLKSVTGIFDRAALVALEQQPRQNYISKLQQLCPIANILLVSFEYPQSEMDGPPFAVAEDEVETHFKADYELKLIESNDILSDNDKFRERGLTSLFEKVFIAKPI